MLCIGLIHNNIKNAEIINPQETIPYYLSIRCTREEIYSQNTSSYLFLGKFA